jgi:hypothetical protein
VSPDPLLAIGFRRNNGENVLAVVPTEPNGGETAPASRSSRDDPGAVPRLLHLASVPGHGYDPAALDALREARRRRYRLRRNLSPGAGCSGAAH